MSLHPSKRHRFKIYGWQDPAPVVGDRAPPQRVPGRKEVPARSHFLDTGLTDHQKLLDRGIHDSLAQATSASCRVAPACCRA
ncbi:hypothetical protein MPL3365_140176 [Mesorhizobium plurifarium]|uniref:Uncharacterized protein n=1 Tax=Mesorhizobium plurifarium TaxID=69974 RepID=A0A090G469_MESPL|nr:hypothetical protein MPL3365_140176 [Mesorhizobium plurifarium]